LPCFLIDWSLLSLHLDVRLSSLCVIFAFASGFSYLNASAFFFLSLTPSFFPPV
jgi:hypothetical protein